MNFKTKYCGIYIVTQNWLWWISDDNGGDQYFGANQPTERDVEIYRTRMIERNGR